MAIKNQVKEYVWSYLIKKHYLHLYVKDRTCEKMWEQKNVLKSNLHKTIQEENDAATLISVKVDF